MDEVTISFTIARQDAEIVMALIGWLRHRAEPPVTIGALELPHPLLYDTPFTGAFPTLCDEVGEAALFYVQHAEAQGWRLHSAVTAFAAHEAERRTRTEDTIARFVREQEDR